MDKPCKVYASRKFEKQLTRLPGHINEAAQLWIASVEEEGIRQVRRLRGYHDEPLHGNRRGQRSVRLSKGYRLFYLEDEDRSVVIIRVLEVNKHDY